MILFVVIAAAVIVLGLGIDVFCCSFCRPFPSSIVPLFQNEFKCETFHMKMSSECTFIFMQIKNGFASRLALK